MKSKGRKEGEGRGGTVRGGDEGGNGRKGRLQIKVDGKEGRKQKKERRKEGSGRKREGRR